MIQASKGIQVSDLNPNGKSEFYPMREKEPFNILKIDGSDQNAQLPDDQLLQKRFDQPDDEEFLESSNPVSEIREKWNSPGGNIGRLAFAFLSFIVAGMSDAVVGV